MFKPKGIMFLVLAAASVLAQDVRPVWYVAEFKIRSNATQWINLVRKYDKPMLDKLMADGTVLAWGLDMMVIRREHAVTHRIWVVTPDYGGMDKVIAGFNAINTPPEDLARYLEVANLAALQEHYMRSILFKVTDVPPTARPYRTYSAIKVKPGKGREWEKLFEKHDRPVLDKLLAKGAIYGYGVDVEEFHSDDPGWRWVWVMTPNMAAFDKIAAAYAKRSEAERAAVAQEFENVTEPGAHRDYLYRTIVTGAPAQSPVSCHGAIVFDSDRTGRSEVYRIDSSGGGVRQLTFSSGPGEFSRVTDLSPNGQNIVFQGKRADGDGLYVIPCTGGDAVPVSRAAGASAPAWSPNGRPRPR